MGEILCQKIQEKNPYKKSNLSEKTYQKNKQKIQMTLFYKSYKLNKEIQVIQDQLNIIQDQSVKLIDQIQQNYLQMKVKNVNNQIYKQFNEYMKSHILLMDENLSVQNLFGVIDIKNLVDVDHFSFIFVKVDFQKSIHQQIKPLLPQYWTKKIWKIYQIICIMKAVQDLCLPQQLKTLDIDLRIAWLYRQEFMEWVQEKNQIPYFVENLRISQNSSLNTKNLLINVQKEPLIKSFSLIQVVSQYFEFDKQGQVIFVSRPISKLQKKEYHINFVPQYLYSSYTSIFKNPTHINHIENHLQDHNKWHLNESKAQYEVFMKMEEKSFQGFVVIFQQGWFSYDSKSLIMDIKMQNKLQKSMQLSESIFYFDNLEQATLRFKQRCLDVQTYRSKKSSTFQSIFEQKNSIEQFDSKALIGQKQINNFISEQLSSPKIENNNNFNFNVLTINVREIESQQFKIPILELCEFLAILEYKYNKKKNKFHNYDHAISVMQRSTFNIINFIINLIQRSIKQFTIICFKFGALCHDVSHKYIRFHDKSVLEQHHAATAIKLMTGSFTSILVNMPNGEFRRYFISYILYNDITEHFKLIKEFQRCMSTLGQQEDDHKLLSGMIIHTSDFS
ncbi:hypothetical protein pb186bvf_019879 [Paramecium bursaria]